MTSVDDFTVPLHSFAWAYDSFDAAACVACFTVDGELVVTGHADKPVRARGAAELQAHFSRALEHRRALGHQPRHLVCNVLVEEADAAQARCRSYSTLMVILPDRSARVEMIGCNLDVLQRVEGVWKIKQRVLRIDGGLATAAR